MASAGNPNSSNQTAPFDVNKFFKPSNLPPQNPSNLGTSAFPPSSYGATPPNPSASYPPPAGPYSYPAQPPFYQSPYPVQDQHSNLQHQRSLSFPTPPLHPTPNAPANANTDGARLMALLSSPASHQPVTPLPPIQPPPPGILEFSRPSSVPLSPSVTPQPVHTISAALSQPSPMRMPSSKLPKGRHLVGEHALYDVDVRLPGEVQPQLEVTPITKYGSDPGLILGHQIAVNKTYICYGLKMGNIRVLNINTALRSLLRGHSQRVTDMAFFAEDVHILASGSIEGRIYVWKISEGSDEEDKPQISGNVVVALHIVGKEESIRPRVCWHCHKQEILVVAIGDSVLRIDTIKVAKGKSFSADEPLQCPFDKLIDGVQFVGKHEGEVTDLSMCQWMTTRLVSASKDGTIKIWEDRKAQPLLVLRPHDGQPVDAATFLTAPHRPDHIVLVTAGPQNREVKLWASSSEEGWLLPSETESWRCVQTLELKSSSEPHIEEAFFNQVVGLSQVGLVLLANAKKNAIYVVHLDYGTSPAGTRMDYLAEFTVTMPILSFTGTSDASPQGEPLVQVYCVQTQAIQQYALDLSQCLPPVESFGLEKSDSTLSHDVIDGGSAIEPSGGSRSFDVSVVTSGPKPNAHSTHESAPEIKRAVSSTSDTVPLQEITPSSVDSNPSTTLLPVSSHVDVSVASSPLPSTVPPSPRLARKASDLCVDQAASDFSVDRQIDNAQTNLQRVSSTDPDNRMAPADVNPPVMFKHPTHLITPSEIMATSSSEVTRLAENKGEGQPKIQDVVVNNESGNLELEVKVVGEAGFAKDDGLGSQGETRVIMDRKEKSFYSQASDLGAQMSREMSRDCCVAETSVVEEAPVGQPSHSGEDEADENSNDLSGKSTDHGALFATPHSTPSTSKGKKHKGKNTEASGPPSSSLGDFYIVESMNEAVASSGEPSMGTALSQLAAMQNMLNQLVSTQKEMQKQMTTAVATPVNKEGRRLEVALGKSMEKAAKANADALWARIQEENAKHEKLVRERTQQIISLITNSFSKDFVALLDKALKKEIATVSTNVTRSITPVIEKTVSSAIADSFQRGVGDKAVNQLERSVSSRIETIISRQIQSQFQTSGKQALQEGLKTVLEANVIPAFEMSCKSMFEQVDTTFRKGMAEHTAAVQHQVESAHSPLAIALREAVNSASSLSRTLSGELADGQRKLLAYATAGASTSAVNPLIPHTNGPLLGLHDKVEQPIDPTKELSRLTAEHKYEEAFTSALHKTDVSIVSWLCSQVDMQSILSMNPTPLSQGVLLALLQQLACDLGKDTLKKLQWMIDVAAAINPRDPLIALHVRPICDQVYQILNHHRSLSTTSSSELASIRVITHVINSMLTACK